MSDTTNNSTLENVKSLLKLSFGVISIFVFMFLLGPLYLDLPLVKPISEVIDKNEIKADALFYTDIEEFAEAEASIRDSLKYKQY